MLRPLQNINSVRIIILTLTLTVFSGVLFLFTYGQDEGTLGDGVIKNLIADVFVFFAFPSLPVFNRLDILNSWSIYFIGLFINSMIYGILIERLFYFFHRTIRQRQ